jgi:hypothetical protein
MVWDELTAGRRFMDPMAPEDMAEHERSNVDIFAVAFVLAEEV